jgi:hypothetical protein
MNEHIKQLSDKAIEIVAKKRILPDGQIERTWRPEYYDQVFAELIVVECINICGGHARDDGTAQRIIEDIKKYFGVEE